MIRKDIHKLKDYTNLQLWDIVFWWSDWFPKESEIMSWLKRNIFGRYYLTRSSCPDENWMKMRFTEKIYISKIEWVAILDLDTNPKQDDVNNNWA